MRETLKAALMHYGLKEQSIKMMEECGELIVEIGHIWAGRGNINKLAEEVADVQIMLEQMKMGFEMEEQVNRFIGEKVIRLKQRLEGEK